ncbi:DNA-binding TFAR19-related protein [Cylindrobasidium torrendii FP15055 ss-10]|uniref:DNA-binding TFAR19-related protein n=1 Tax=Cylindrobasidium torrendii FP15055 ss-10 TaxID=1314674 RepID=A0A0D7BED1_9AGAR|nr:DNA-binding TFAR19-related protein [Cylindrobasidium torrendii FP15055 ss-10]
MENLPQNLQNPGAGGSGPSPEEQAQQAQQEEAMRRDMMATVLDPAARERLSRISIVSPDRSKQIETILARMATSGQLRGRVSEAQLIDLLDQFESAQGGKTASKSTIKFQRKTDWDDDLDF